MFNISAVTEFKTTKGCTGEHDNTRLHVINIYLKRQGKVTGIHLPSHFLEFFLLIKNI